MQIFIGHASEDKADFVRPLAEALRQEFRVWYDEYELTVGDSLLKKINEGLLSSDYGVVVLSRSFFQKKWPQAELDGLFALEGTTRKMILPVWKDVSVEDVKAFSPILAGRLATNASDGVEKVVNELRKAIEVSTRTREITAFDSVILKARSIDQNLRERRNADRLSRCEEGVALVSEGFTNFCTTMESSIEAAQKTSEILKFRTNSLQHPLGGTEFTIRTNYQLAMDIHLVRLGGNYTYEAEIVVRVYKRNIQRFGAPDEVDEIRQMNFKPTFRLPKQLMWVESGRKKIYATGELVALLLETLLNEIQKCEQNT